MQMQKQCHTHTDTHTGIQIVGNFYFFSIFQSVIIDFQMNLASIVLPLIIMLALQVM